MADETCITRGPAELRSLYSSLIEEHRQWLSCFKPEYRKKWDDHFNSDDQTEAAIGEAWVCKLLRGEATSVEPADEPGIGGPDFIADVSGSKFYVEVTNIGIETMTGRTKFYDIQIIGGVYCSPLKLIQNKVIEKQKVASRVKDFPTVVAITTFHFSASYHFDRQLCQDVLISPESYVIPLPTETETFEGSIQTNLRLSAFMKLTNDASNPIEGLRPSISALLLCGVGVVSPNDDLKQIPRTVWGIINPYSTIAFNRKLLHRIPFLQVANTAAEGQIKVETM